MNDKYKTLVEELANVLCKQTNGFLLKHLINEGGEADTTDLLNLVLSGHLSSLSSLMRFISKDQEDIYKMVNKFLDNLVRHVAVSEPIQNVEIMPTRKDHDKNH